MRMQFGGGPEDVYLIADEDNDLQQGGGIVIRMYSSETGDDPILDLQNLANDPISYVTTSDGTDGRAAGQIAPFLGPDGIYEMWAGPEDQPRFLLQSSNLGSVLGAAHEDLIEHMEEVNGHSTRLRDLLDVDAGIASATTGQVLVYDSTSGWWEAGDVEAASASGVSDILWVAASNAPAAFDNAPYQCDGTNDEVEINTALNNVFGMRVGLSPGTFNVGTDPIQLLGANDVEVEVSRYLQGSGTYATRIVVADGVDGGIFLGNAVCPHVSDLTVEIEGTSQGIFSEEPSAPAAGKRSFWHGSIKNILIKGPWDGTHTAWGMRLGAGFRYVVENIEVAGVGNGIKVLNEDADFNCGDATFTRCFVEIIGASGIAYHVSSPSGNGNQLTFNTCHGIAQPADASTTCWRFDGAGATSHVRTINCNAEQFTTTVKVDNTAYDIDVDLVHVTLKNGAVLADLDGHASKVRCGLAYVEASATVTLVDDDNTYSAKPNILGPISIYAETGSTVNVDVTDTVVLRDIVSDGPGTVAASVKRPIGVMARKSVALTDGATITPDASQGDDFRVTLGGNRTLAAPTNPTDGQHMTLLVTQDGTGSRTLTFNSVFVFGTITATLTTTASRRDLFEFVYNSTLSKWLVLNASKNLT